MDYNLTKQERETVIVFNEAEKTAEVYTCSQSMIRKMDALVAEYDSFSFLFCKVVVHVASFA